MNCRLFILNKRKKLPWTLIELVERRDIECFRILGKIFVVLVQDESRKETITMHFLNDLIQFFYKDTAYVPFPFSIASPEYPMNAYGSSSVIGAPFAMASCNPGAR